MVFYDYPMGSDTPPYCPEPGDIPNSANCETVGWVTEVGAYTASASPYGTFDQGGNAYEWVDTIVDGAYRGLRGGYFLSHSYGLTAAHRNYNDPLLDQSQSRGFRVASSVPPPAVPALDPLGLLLVSAGLLGASGYYPRRRG
jgi:hypothetical protein